MDDEAVELNLNGEILELSLERARWLADLPNHPGWAVFTEMLVTMERGTTEALQSLDQPLDTIRGLQGRLSVAKDVRALVEQGVPSWVKAVSKENA